MTIRTKMNNKFSKSIVICFLLLAFFALEQQGFAQSQNIGFSPNMDGGFENQLSSGAAAVFLNPPSSYYTVNSSNSVVSFNGTGGRSGPKYISWTVSGSSSNGFYTPTDNGAISSNTSYIVQFYYKNSSTSNTKSFNISISPDGTSSFGSAGNTGTLAATSWTKVTKQVNSGTASTLQNGTVRFTPNSTFSTAYYIDDIVVYPGTQEDVSAPDVVTSPTVNAGNTSLTLQWTAPSTTDGGGYMVIRYASDPSSSAGPLTNGIYGVGNSIGNGTVVYLGAANTFVDNGLTNSSTYYYRIYTVDKAFNYSAAVVANGTTTNNSTLTNLTVTNNTLLATTGDVVGIGTTTPTQKLDVIGNIRTSGKLFIGDINDAKISSLSDYTLAVNGTALFTKAKVKLSGNWPDYVFEDKYPLLSLGSLEKFIRENKHLPQVPTAFDIEKNGIDVGVIQTTLVQKIEELTLYIIDQNKKIEEQQNKINKLESQSNQLQKLQKQVDELSKLIIQ